MLVHGGLLFGGSLLVAQRHGQGPGRHHPAVEPGAVVERGEMDVDPQVRADVLQERGGELVGVLDRVRGAHAGEGVGGLHQGHQLELEVLGREPGQDAVGEVGRRRVDLPPQAGDGFQQGVVVELLVGLVHARPPVRTSSTRSFSRHRPRVGPMLPTGMPRSEAMAV